SLFFTAFDLQENQSAYNENDQADSNDCFHVHYSASSFLDFFLKPITPRTAAPAAEMPSRESQRAGFLSSPVFGVSRSSLCISTVVTAPSNTLAVLSAGST